MLGILRTITLIDFEVIFLMHFIFLKYLFMLAPISNAQVDFNISRTSCVFFLNHRIKFMLRVIKLLAYKKCVQLCKTQIACILLPTCSQRIREQCQSNFKATHWQRTITLLRVTPVKCFGKKNTKVKPEIILYPCLCHSK